MKKYIKPETVLVNISHAGIIAQSCDSSLPFNDGVSDGDIVSDQGKVLGRENIWDVEW